MAKLGLPAAPRAPGLGLVAGAMMVLGCLALALALLADGVARGGLPGGDTLTVQIPQPGAASASGGTRRDAALAVLRAAPGVVASRALRDGELADLLRPFLGRSQEALALPLPGVIEVQLDEALADPSAIAAVLGAKVPGTVIERETGWLQPLRQALRRVRLLAAAGGALVLLVTSLAVIGAARAALPARVAAATILHGLGAGDRRIAGWLAGPGFRQCLTGGVVGLALAVPVLFGLALLVSPALLPGNLAAVPLAFWGGVLGLLGWYTLVGWITLRLAVRRVLRRMG